MNRTACSTLALCWLVAAAGSVQASGEPRLELRVLVQPTVAEGLVVLESRAVWPDSAPVSRHRVEDQLSYRFDLLAGEEVLLDAWSDDPITSCIGETTLLVGPGSALRELHVFRLPPGWPATEAGRAAPRAVRARTLAVPGAAGHEPLSGLRSQAVALERRLEGPPADARMAALLAQRYRPGVIDPSVRAEEPAARVRVLLEQQLSPALAAFARVDLGVHAARASRWSEALRWLEGLDLPPRSLLSLRAAVARAEASKALGREEAALRIVRAALAEHEALARDCSLGELKLSEESRDVWGSWSRPACWRLQGLFRVEVRLTCDAGERWWARTVDGLPAEDRRLLEEAWLDHSAQRRSLRERLSHTCWEAATPELEAWTEKQAQDWMQTALRRERTARELGLRELVAAGSPALEELRLDEDALSAHGRRLLVHDPPYSPAAGYLGPGETVGLFPTRAEALASMLDGLRAPSAHPVPGGPGELAVRSDAEAHVPDENGMSVVRSVEWLTFLRGNVVARVRSDDLRFVDWLDRQVAEQLEARGGDASRFGSVPRVVAVAGAGSGPAADPAAEAAESGSRRGGAGP